MPPHTLPHLVVVVVVIVVVVVVGGGGGVVVVVVVVAVRVEGFFAGIVHGCYQNDLQLLLFPLQLFMLAYRYVFSRSFFD